VTSNVAGWLVAVFSLLSRKTVVPPVPAISMPKLAPGLTSQLLTNAVTSTSRKVLAVLTGALANDGLVEGPGEVTPVSSHEAVTWEKVSDPPAMTLSTYTRK
jgi:hypothetical protein